SYGTSPSAIRDRLFSTADAIPGTGLLWANGRVNASSAVGGATLPLTTSTPTPTATSTSTPLPTATSAPGSQTVSFDDLTAANRTLNGQYPTGLIDWGSNTWWLASPWGQFNTNSISFNG